MAKNNDELGKMSFEKALDELEQLVKKMEDGNLSLDEMLSCFERGCNLSKACRAKLERLEKKIEVLLKDDGQDGEWGDFEPSSSREAASTASRKNTAADLPHREPSDEPGIEDSDQEGEFLF